MREKPWQVINVITNETLGWYENDDIAYLTHAGEPISVIYRPGRKKKVKK